MMETMVDFSVSMLEAIASFLGSEPIIYIFALVCLVCIVKIFKIIIF